MGCGVGVGWNTPERQEELGCFCSSAQHARHRGAGTDGAVAGGWYWPAQHSTAMAAARRWPGHARNDAAGCSHYVPGARHVRGGQQARDGTGASPSGQHGIHEQWSIAMLPPPPPLRMRAPVPPTCRAELARFPVCLAPPAERGAAAPTGGWGGGVWLNNV